MNRQLILLMILSLVLFRSTAHKVYHENRQVGIHDVYHLDRYHM